MTSDYSPDWISEDEWHARDVTRAKALGARTVIRLGSGKPLNPIEMLAMRHWFEERQRALREPE